MRWRSVLTVAALVGGAIAGIVATSEAAGANACANPTLATGLQGWGALDKGTASRVAVRDLTGARWAFATTGRSFYLPQIAVSPGQRWTVSARDRLLNGSGTARLTVEWYSSGGAYLGAVSGPPATLTSTTWTPVSASVVVPSGATSAHVLQSGSFGSSTDTRFLSTSCHYGQGPVTTVPGAPTRVGATVSGTSATLTWSVPADTGGSAITGYTYGRDGVDSRGTGRWTGTTGGATRSATFNLLKRGTTYRLSVTASNAAGTGLPAVVTVTIPATTPPAPTATPPAPTATAPAPTVTAPAPTVTVPAPTVTVPVPATGSPSGIAMPTGDLPDWRQVFTEDFTSDVALGSWPGTYASKWQDYTLAGSRDTNGGAEWNTVKAVSVSGGAADYYLRSENGTAYSAAILPRTAAQTYGRYEVRFKVDAGMTGWKSAWLLWPDSEKWPAHGEIDWPEGDLTGRMEGFMHHADPKGGQDHAGSGVPFASGWHTATTEWLPGSVKYYLDGALVGSFTKKVSSYPMHWVLQSESSSSSRPAGSGHIKIDWAVIYTPA